VKRYEDGTGIGETWRMKKKRKIGKQRQGKESSGMRELVNNTRIR
jgi:hypothetical protein